MSETCCTQLAENAGCKNRHLGTIQQLCWPISLQLRLVSPIKKNLLSSNISPTGPCNMVNFGVLAAEVVSLIWGTPANFNGFHILAVLLHSTPVLGISQTLRHWTEGASYVWQGGHHAGHWPTFLVIYWLTAKWPIIFVVSVCLFVCAEFFSAVFDPISIKLGHMLYVWVELCPLEYRGCATPGGWVTSKKTCIFRGFGAQRPISFYSFDHIVLIFGYIVQCTNTKILSSHFFAISILNPNYDVISGFAKVVGERCGFHHWIAQTISWGKVVSIFSISYSFRVMTSSMTS